MIDTTKIELVIKNKEKAVVKMPIEEYNKLIVSNENDTMCFSEAYKALKHGNKIARKNWEGYWVKENDSIMMYCKNGLILDIRYTSNVFFTFDNIAADDWVIVNGREIKNCVECTYSYEDALKFLKSGENVYREKWDCNTVLGIVNKTVFNPGKPYIVIKRTDKCDNFYVEPYMPSNEDIFAKDWHVLKED